MKTSVTKRNGKGVWLRENQKILKRFDASLEWVSERIAIREEEIEKTRKDEPWNDVQRARS